MLRKHIISVKYSRSYKPIWYYSNFCKYSIKHFKFNSRRRCCRSGWIISWSIKTIFVKHVISWTIRVIYIRSTIIITYVDFSSIIYTSRINYLTISAWRSGESINSRKPKWFLPCNNSRIIIWRCKRFYTLYTSYIFKSFCNIWHCNCSSWRILNVFIFPFIWAIIKFICS